MTQKHYSQHSDLLIPVNYDPLSGFFFLHGFDFAACVDFSVFSGLTHKFPARMTPGIRLASHILCIWRFETCRSAAVFFPLIILSSLLYVFNHNLVNTSASNIVQKISKFQNSSRILELKLSQYCRSTGACFTAEFLTDLLINLS